MTQTQPLALVLFERLLPGNQIVNRLQDMNYRVQTLGKAEELVRTAEQVKPLVVLADLDPNPAKVFAALTQLRKDPATKHVPAIVFSSQNSEELKPPAEAAGVTLLVGETAILNHLPQVLDQALQVE